VDGETVREVPTAALVPGSVVELRSGDTVPADGIVLDGTSTLDLSLLTGESRPVDAAPGQPVHAGTVNLSGRLRVEVKTTGESTRVGRLLRMVEENAGRRAPVIKLADRISGWFVVTVLTLALVTLLIWLKLDPEHAVDHAVALLIVSCPCALGLATPLAVAAAVGRAAGRGILVKGGDALEELARTGHMFLDKTGTLTEGRMSLVRFVGDDRIKGAVASLESHSSHPVATALVEGLGPQHDLEVTDVRNHPGFGLTGRFGDRRLLAGSSAFAGHEGIAIPNRWTREIHAAVGDGLTPIVICLDDEVVGLAALGDAVRADAPSTLERIRAAGWTLEVLSGDHPGTVAAVMRSLGLDTGRGGADPELKSELVHQAASRGRVVMVGDGVNDAAALAAATVGVGVHGGAEAALAAADVFLGREGLSPVAELLEGARRTLGVIRRNLIFSLSYNVVAVSLAMAGFMHPLVAAILMPLSSITVVVSSYRAKTF
jgi:Cu2+-exporting ATPase